jgi:hypothetical protein
MVAQRPSAMEKEAEELRIETAISDLENDLRRLGDYQIICIFLAVVILITRFLFAKLTDFNTIFFEILIKMILLLLAGLIAKSSHYKWKRRSYTTKLAITRVGQN